MITLGINEQQKNFSSIQQLYDFIINTGLITEVKEIDEDDLTDKQKVLLDEVRNTPESDLLNL